MSSPRYLRGIASLAVVLLAFCLLSACDLPAVFAEVEVCPRTSLEVTWPPPALIDPITIHVAADHWQQVYKLDANKDYIVEMPKKPVTRGLAFSGGRNIVLIGGEIAIPWRSFTPSIASRTGLRIKGATGTVHIEGLLIRGEDVSEGIQIAAPDAIVQIENVGVFNIHARDQISFSDNHPDVIQTYGNVKKLRIDRFTGSTDYQGLFFVADFNGPHGAVVLKRVNIIGNATARNLLWLQPQAGAGRVTLDEVYLDTGGMVVRNLSEAVWPNGRGKFPNQVQMTLLESVKQKVTWPEDMEPRVNGYVLSSRPPNGDFVSPSHVGVKYCPGVYHHEPESPVMANNSN